MKNTTESEIKLSAIEVYLKYIKHTELKYKIYLFKMAIFFEVTFSSSG